MKDSILLAFTRAAVANLNENARLALKEKNLLGQNEIVFQSTEKELKIATGERLLFRQNDKAIGVRNGDLGTVHSINFNHLQVKLDSGELLNIPKTYQALDYGYALTVHKSQGMTVKDTYVLIDSKYWDKHLSFVAMTRHKENLKLYADKINHPTINDLKRTLSRSVTRDNVIDWPLDFAIRAGFNPDRLIGKAVNHLAGIGHKIKNGFNYVVNSEAYLKTQNVHAKNAERQNSRKIAQQLAAYLDEKYILQREIKNFEKQAKAQSVDKSQLEGFEALYTKTLTRDKRAYDLLNEHSASLARVTTMNKAIEAVKHDANRHERYRAVARIAAHQPSNRCSDSLIQASSSIDLKKDYVHIVREAAKHNKKPSEIYQQIDGLQKMQRQACFSQMKKEYPLLAQYDELHAARTKASGFKMEQLDKALLMKAKEIINQKALNDALKKQLPKFADKLMVSINVHEMGRDI